MKVLPGIEVHLSPEIVQDIDAGKAFPLMTAITFC